jgi:hypothetical protein
MEIKCFYFKKIIFNNPIFDKNIDATYVLHLENNGRYEQMINQLNKYNITNIVYILFNKGFKKCNKKKFINNTLLDIVDANLTIFKHAKQKKFNNILIFEDDFILTDEIKSEKNINNINDFLENHENKKFMYSLGTVPYIAIPYNLHTYRTLFYGGSHAVIYSKKIRDKYLSINQKEINDWDMYKLNNMKKYSYMYYKPLCYQLFPQTENQKNWIHVYNNIFWVYLVKLSYYLIKKIKLDKHYEPGFTYVYNVSKILSLFLFILMLYTINIIIKLL